ncbi:MAG: hypothetical protein ACTSVV_05065 [Promethearchaeota archaeon]
MSDKCSNCKSFRPWLIIKNVPEGFFLLKKIIEKFEPWVYFGRLKNLYDLEEINIDSFDYFFILILNSKNNPVFKLIQEKKELITDCNIQLKTHCNECEDFIHWILYKKDPRTVDLIRKFMQINNYYVNIKKFKVLYKHNIPEEYFSISKWTKNIEKKFK